MRGTRSAVAVKAAARKAVATVAAVAAALTLAVGCGSDRPAGGTGSTGGNAAAGSNDQATPSPGASGGGGGGATAGESGGGAGGASGGGSGGSAATGTACALLTSEDASRALGASVTNNLDAANQCGYEAGDNAVMFSIRTEAYDASSASMLTQLGPVVQKLDGIGDGAFKVSLGQETQFYVWTKGKYLAIIVTRESGDTDTPARQLLDKVLARI